MASRAVAGVAHVGAPAAEGPQPPLQLPGQAGTFSQLPKAQASSPAQAFGLVSAPPFSLNRTSMHVAPKQVLSIAHDCQSMRNQMVLAPGSSPGHAR